MFNKRNGVRFFGILVILGILLSAYGCSHNQQLQAFYAADKEFTNAVQQYNLQYDAASSQVQAKWRKTIDPIVLQADEALKMWNLTIYAQTDPSDRVSVFLELKTKLLSLLIQEGIIVVKEE